MKCLRIEKEKMKKPYITTDGNIEYRNQEMFVLKNKDGEIISYGYYYMLPLDNKHIAVCNIINGMSDFPVENEYDIINGNYKLETPKLKWGIVRLNFNDGILIPFGETLVIPYIYDRIYSNNLATATAYCGKKLTYIDLDTSSPYYAKQLVPCILEHAVPFNATIEKFAECSIDGTIGYLPRNCKARKRITKHELLTIDQAIAISQKQKGEESYVDTQTTNKYYELTGKLVSENIKLERK